MMKTLAAGVSGLIFGLGLIVSGMTNPMKVQNFLDIAGAGDPSLALVMASALAVTALGYRLVLPRQGPVFEEQFSLPEITKVDSRLLAGSAIFGVGWGIAGLCPGPALTASLIAPLPVLIFVAAMLAAILAWRWRPQARAQA